MRGDVTTASDDPPPTVADLEAWARAAGWQDPIVYGSLNNDYVALIVGRRWHCLVLPDRLATIDRLWRSRTAGLAVVATPAEVAEALAFFGLLSPQPAEI